ncbi:inhibin alpha chain [Polymixia lowei]
MLIVCPTDALSCILLFLGPLWLRGPTQACQGDELPREVVLDWFKRRVLDGLGLEEPPAASGQGPDGGMAPSVARQGRWRSSRTSRAAWADNHHNQHLENSQIILFPSPDSPCARSTTSAREPDISHFTYYFQPSMSSQEVVVTSAHFWFYAGIELEPNTSAPLFALTSERGLLRLAELPSRVASDGWATYYLESDRRAFITGGPFVLQVRCATCRCRDDEPDKMSFLHLYALPRWPDRSPRRAASVASVASAALAVDRLQRPSPERPEHGDCSREEVDVSFDELGWGNWIVHPKVLTFRYCHGNCSAAGRAAAALGIQQCCAPVPGTMRSLRITTTSDGGYSFKYETLPNIMPEECTCI